MFDRNRQKAKFKDEKEKSTVILLCHIALPSATYEKAIENWSEILASPKNIFNIIISSVFCRCLKSDDLMSVILENRVAKLKT